MTVTKGQIKAIHTIKSKIGLCDEYYRCMLSQYGVESSKDLTFEQAEGLWATLQQMAKEAGIGKRKITKGKKYDDLEADGKRDPSMATPRQLRMIEAIWSDVSYMGNARERAKALRVFIEKRFRVSDLRFVTKTNASKIIKTLEAMLQSKMKKKGADNNGDIKGN